MKWIRFKYWIINLDNVTSIEIADQDITFFFNQKWEDENYINFTRSKYGSNQLFQEEFDQLRRFVTEKLEIYTYEF